MNKTAQVFFQERLAGLLSKTSQGYEFQYFSEYLESPEARSIAFCFPLQKEKYESSTLFSFFDGLIPEGWYLEIVSKTLKVDSKDRFGLLLATAHHTIGAVTLKPLENP